MCSRNFRYSYLKNQIQPEYGDEQADAGQDCRNRLARPNSQARTGTGKSIFPVQLTTSRVANFTRLIVTPSICDGHTYHNKIHKNTRDGSLYINNSFQLMVLDKKSIITT